ncbi:unnamed protein product, partial [Didymodactylos carnosus]
ILMPQIDNVRISKEQVMLEDCQKLLDQNEELDKPDKYGITLLHIAAAKAYENVVRLLIKNSVNVDARDETGATALHLSAKHSQGLIIKLLLDAKANPCLRDKFGRKPSEVARETVIRLALICAEVKHERYEQSEDSLEEEQENFETEDDDDDERLFIMLEKWPVKNATTTETLEQKHSQLKEEEDVQTLDIDIFHGTSTGHESSLPNKYSNDDLAQLPEINEQSLLFDLEIRFRQGQVYVS